MIDLLTCQTCETEEWRPASMARRFMTDGIGTRIFIYSDSLGGWQYPTSTFVANHECCRPPERARMERLGLPLKPFLATRPVNKNLGSCLTFLESPAANKLGNRFSFTCPISLLPATEFPHRRLVAPLQGVVPAKFETTNSKS